MNCRRRAADLSRDLRGRNALRQQGPDAISASGSRQHGAPKCNCGIQHTYPATQTLDRAPLFRNVSPRPAEIKRCGGLGASSVCQFQPDDRRSGGRGIEKRVALGNPQYPFIAPERALQCEKRAAGGQDPRPPERAHPARFFAGAPGHRRDIGFISTTGSSRQPVRRDGRCCSIAGSVR